MFEIFGFIIPLIVILVIVGIFLSFVPLGLWISAVSAGVRVNIFSLVGMRLRRVRADKIIRPLIKAQKAGMDVNPETDVKELVPYMEDVEMILIMSVQPGFGGQKFIPESLDKIREVRAMLNEKNLETDIQVDGGIYVENVREVLDAGANVIVAGSAVFRGDAGENTAKFMEILKSYE